jgi:NAD(P)-dependent dehydrogenase (short-subunit alcohol dehydrogenase family)
MKWTKNNMPDQAGKTVIVTGANAGIGFETALAFYEKGAHVILACRSLDNAQQAIAKIQKHNGAGSLEAGLLNLANLASIKEFAQTFLQQHRQLHLLINNAGVMIPPASKTDDGFELQFGVTPGSRVITLSSLAYLHGTINFDNLKSEIDYNAMREYCQSKLGNLIFSLELQRRINAKGHQVLSVGAQPGANKTELARHMSEEAHAAAVQRVGQLMDPWQGALPSLYAAVEDKIIGGALYGPDQDGGYRGYPAQAVITLNAIDEAVGQKLWEFAEAVTGVYYPL